LNAVAKDLPVAIDLPVVTSALTEIMRDATDQMTDVDVTMAEMIVVAMMSVVNKPILSTCLL
jgi:hypothetical protein